MQDIIHLINEMSPYLLLGFLIAGVLHVFVPSHYYQRFLSKPSFRSVVDAAILGIPLPLCSCGVIPTAMSLHKEGASKGATTSFLIATPQTGIDSILATYGMMGLPFAIVRPIAALVTALLGGTAANIFDKKQSQQATVAANCSCQEPETGNKLLRVLKYAYIDMLGDIGRWLVLGLVLAGVITIAVPDQLFTLFEGNTLASMLLVLCISVPMYLCATGSIPIAVALMMKGLTPGAALVLLMAGPACNIASMMVVKQVLGLRSMIVYLASIVIGAIGFGCLIDLLQFGGHINFLGNLTAAHCCCTTLDAWWAWASTGALTAMLIYTLVVRKLIHKHKPTTENSENMKTYTVEGMNCNHCRLSAENAIKSVEGVTSATVDLDTKEARVEGTATEEAICQAVEKVGFHLKSRQ